MGKRKAKEQILSSKTKRADNFLSEIVTNALDTIYDSDGMTPLGKKDFKALQNILNDLYANFDDDEKVAKISHVSPLAKLYPHLTGPHFFTKLSNTNSVHSFFKEFAPYFYLQFAEKVTSDPAFAGISDITSHLGWCAGDAHIENFASLLNGQGHSVFTISSFTEAGRGLLVADVVRFLVSVIFGVKNLPDSEDFKITDDEFKTVVEAYFSGLTSEVTQPRVWESRTVKHAIHMASNCRNTPAPGLIPPYGKTFIRTENMLDVPKCIQNQMLETLTAACRLNVLHDAFEYDNSIGINAGVEQYTALVATCKVSPNYVIMDFKEVPRMCMSPLNNFVEGGINAPLPERLPITLKHAIPSGIIKYYSTQSLDYLGTTNAVKDYFISPRYSGQSNIQISNIPKLLSKNEFIHGCVNSVTERDFINEYLRLVRDEAFTLGQFHKSSADNFDAYVSVVKDVKWWEITQYFVTVMNDEFVLIRK